MLSKLIFVALVGLIVITPIPYGSVEPWWKAAFVCAVFGIWIIALIETLKNRLERIEGASILLPMLALSLLAVLQTLSLGSRTEADLPVWNTISADPYQTRFFALQILALTVLLALLYRYASAERRVRVLVYTVLAVAVASAVFGIMRQTTQQETGFLLPLLKKNQGYGQFISKNHFAYLMEMALGLGLGIILGAGVARERVMIYVALLLPIWTGLVLANSRGGILAMLAQVVVAVLLIISRSDYQLPKIANSPAIRAVLLVVLVVGILLGTFWVGGDRLASNFENATSEIATTPTRAGASRNEIWRATLKMFAAHPILGVGLGGYWIGITAYHDASGLMTPQEAHNDYLELLSSGGLIGLAIGLWFAVVVVRKIRQNLLIDTGYKRAVRLGAVLGITGVAAHSLVDFGLHITTNAVVFIVLIMIATSRIESGVRRPGAALVISTKAPPRRRTPNLNSMALPLVIFLVIRPVPVQDIGGSLAFQGQDIIGGAAVIFKTPKRVKDLTGGAAAMMASRRPQRTGRTSDVARNNPPDRRPTTVVATATPAERAEAFKVQGDNYYDLGDFAKALEAYQNALKLMPQDAEAQGAIGDTYLTLNRLAEAASAYEKTVQLQPNNAAAYSNLGYAYDKLGRVSDSVTALRNAVRLKSDDEVAFNNLGASLYKAGRYQEALEAFNNAVRLNPNDADALNNLGAVYYALEQYERARESFQRAVNANATSADAQYNLGNAYYMLAKHREAATAYRKAIELNPNYVEARTNLGSLLISLGDLQTATSELQQSIKLRPNNAVAFNNLGYAYAKIAETADRTAAVQYLRQAVDAYKEALRLKPDYVKALNNLGAAYNKLGQYQEAADVLARAARAKPDFAEGHYNLGTAFYNRNQFKEAIAEFQQAVRVKRDYADAYNSLGTALYRDSQFEPAIEAYKKTLALKPANAETNNNLGTVYFRTKRYQEAAASFKEAIRIRPDYSEAHFNLALAYVALNDKKGALEQYNRLKKLDPKLADDFFQKYMKK